MSREQWAGLLHRIKRDRAERCLVLEPGTASIKADLAEAERALGAAAPPAVSAALERWPEQGGEFLLTALPRLLNPSATAAQLEPGGASMRALFPTFCQLIDRTEHFAVIIDLELAREPYDPDFVPAPPILLAGLGDDLIPAGRRGAVTTDWAFYLPQTVETIEQHEATSGLLLSPQLKQMVLRANGAPEGVPPEFYPVEWLERGLLADLYRDIWAEVDSPEPFARLEAFVYFYETGTGDCQGFFADEAAPGEEYVIYGWDHETARFTLWARDFAHWLERILVQGW